VVTTKINGSLQGHLPSCAYRLKYEQAGYEKDDCSNSADYPSADDFD
jgi:hypothetical protein